MSGRPGRRPPTRPRSRIGYLLPLLSAIGIGAILLGLLVVIIPPTIGGGSSNDNSSNTIQVTPGAEEAQMRARLKDNPNDVNAMVILASLLANNGQGTEAIQWYGKAVDIKPDDESLRVAFGSVLMQYNFYLDAEIQLQKANDVTPSDPQPMYLLGQLYENKSPSDPEMALQFYQQAASVAPDSVYAQLANDRIAAIKATPGATPDATPGGTP